MHYQKYLKSKKWKKIRSRKFRESPLCESMDCDGLATICHHLSYLSLGDESNSELLALCLDHHNQIHTAMVRKNLSVLEATHKVTAIPMSELLSRSQELERSSLGAFRYTRFSSKKGEDQ